VYFRGDDDALWKIDTTGHGQQQIGTNSTSDTPIVVGDTVYFQGTAPWFGRHKLWKVDTDGNNLQQIGDNYTNSTPFVTPEGWVFFQGDDNKLWKVFNDGSQQYQMGDNTTQSTPFVSTAGPVDLLAELKDWADKAWRWFSSHGFFDDAGSVLDSLGTSAAATGQCNRDPTQAVWSYNQGVILGALCDMADITGADSYLKAAERIADAFIAQRASDPQLQDPNDPNSPVIGGKSGVDGNHVVQEWSSIDNVGAKEGVDNCQFKGIFVRNLARLCVKTRNARYAAFIRRNARIAIQNMDGDNHFGHQWDESPDMVDFVRQTSGLDLLNAALQVQEVVPVFVEFEVAVPHLRPA